MKKITIIIFFGVLFFGVNAQNTSNLGDMQSKLLLKIEELTLYTIEQQKHIEVLEKRLSELENKKGGE